MSFKSSILHSFAGAAIILSFSVLSFADTIRLKDGGVVKGKVVGFRGGQFVISIGDGSRQRQMTFFSDEIEAIEFDSQTAVTTAAGNNPVMNIPTQSSVPATNPPKVIQTDTAGTTTTNPAPVNPTNSTTNPLPKPIRINSKVLADNTSNGWTNTGWVVKKGQKIRISGTGRISLGNGRYATPSGVASIADSEKLLKDKPTGGLIAVIGDDNNDFVFVGASYEFTATRDGALFLGINEGYLDDNSGAFDIAVEIDPATTE